MLVLASASPRRRELLAQAGFSFEVHPAQIAEEPKPGEDPIAYVIRLAREKAQAVFRELTYAPATTASGSDLYQGATSQAAEKWGTGGEFPEEPPSGAKAHVDSTLLTARLKSCPDTKQGFSAACSVVPQAHQNDAGALAPEGFLSDASTAGALSFSRTLRKGWETTNLNPQSLVVLGADTTVTLDNHILGKPADPADAARILRLLSGRTHRVITGVAVVTAERVEVAAEVTGVKFLTLSDEEIAAYVATGEPMDKAGAYAIQGRAARWIPRIEGDYFNVVGLPLALVSALLESRSLLINPAQLPIR
jgi:septum formation protein